jgi:hypothetical protein
MRRKILALVTTLMLGTATPTTGALAGHGGSFAGHGYGSVYGRFVSSHGRYGHGRYGYGRHGYGTYGLDLGSCLMSAPAGWIWVC